MYQHRFSPDISPVREKSVLDVQGVRSQIACGVWTPGVSTGFSELNPYFCEPHGMAHLAGKGLRVAKKRLRRHTKESAKGVERLRAAITSWRCRRTGVIDGCGISGRDQSEGSREGGIATGEFAGIHAPEGLQPIALRVLAEKDAGVDFFRRLP